MSLNENWQKIKTHQDELWLILAAMLGLGLALGLWQWQANRRPPEPLRIENVPEEGTSLTLATSPSTQAHTSQQKFVASKNGTRYYLPTCSGVKRIKEENKIWFATADEARARGLTPAINCPGL